MKKAKQIYEGKAKILYETESPDLLIQCPEEGDDHRKRGHEQQDLDEDL